MTIRRAHVRRQRVGPRDSAGPMPDAEAGVPASHQSHSVTTVGLVGVAIPDAAAARPADPLYLKFRIKYLRVRSITRIQ